MKSLIKITCMIFTITILSSSTVFAFTYDKIDNITEIMEPASDWAQPEIDKAKAAGLLTGSTSVFFQKDITRYAFAELVVNMVEKVIAKELPAATGNIFTDSQDIAVLKAYQAGIVNGIDATTFSPDALITREQISTMLYRAILYIEKEKGKEYTTKNSNMDSYTDKEEISDWARIGVGVLANNKIMQGTSATNLSPKSNTTIEQSIILVYRLYDKLAQKSTESSLNGALKDEYDKAMKIYTEATKALFKANIENKNVEEASKEVERARAEMEKAEKAWEAELDRWSHNKD